MMAGNPNWWNMYLHPPSYLQLPPSQAPPPQPPPSSLVPSPSPSSPYFFHPQFVVGSPPPAQPTHTPQLFSDSSVVDHGQLPHSWSQLLLRGMPVEEVGHFQTRKLGNWESEDVKMANRTPGADAKQDAVSPGSNNSSNDAYAEELLLPLVMPTPWAHPMMPVSSPTSCLTSLSGGNVWDFSKTTKEFGKNRKSDHSSECNSTAATVGASKKARVHPPSSSQPPLKVRKEKLGDRITSLHQLVSPFGKTDTASVLLEAIGYIRFLQGQIEALSSPYMRNNSGGSGNMGTNHHPVHGETGYAFPGDAAAAQDNHGHPMDLRSRGLCLVPVSCTAQVGNDNGADYWAPPAFGGGGF